MPAPTTVGPVSVADLVAGDLLDLEHDPYANHDEFCGGEQGHADGHCVFAHELVCVGDDYDKTGKYLGNGWFRVYTQNYGGSFVVPSDHQLVRVDHID